MFAYYKAWLPDGYNQILRLYVFGPSGFWTMAPLRYTAKFDPLPWRNPRKGKDKILPSGKLVSNYKSNRPESVHPDEVGVPLQPGVVLVVPEGPRVQQGVLRVRYHRFAVRISRLGCG